jgi:dTDP-4-amino-4,6-dideoxygalactose transaminase
MHTSSNRVPLANPALDNAPDRERILTAVARVIDDGAYILGPQVAEFEGQMAKRYGVAGAIGVGSGTDALILALKSLGVGRGDEVVTVSHTAGPTVAAICALDATPVLVDIDEETYCIDPGTLEAACGEKTKAILVVHLYGHPADMDKICAFANSRHIPVIEDCAQAQEATSGGRFVGSIGLLSCFSFYPTKNLGAIGDGGLVMAQTPEVVERVRQLRTYGWTKPQYAAISGGRCSRLDEMQAAILNVKLAGLDESVTKRRLIAARYAKGLSGLPLTLPSERADCRHAYHIYVIRSDWRDALADYLSAAGISTGRHYPYPVHNQPAFQQISRVPGALTVTERIQGEILSLPMFPSLSLDQQDRVIGTIRAFFGKR